LPSAIETPLDNDSPSIVLFDLFSPKKKFGGVELYLHYVCVLSEKEIKQRGGHRSDVLYYEGQGVHDT